MASGGNLGSGPHAAADQRHPEPPRDRDRRRHGGDGRLWPFALSSGDLGGATRNMLEKAQFRSSWRADAPRRPHRGPPLALPSPFSPAFSAQFFQLSGPPSRSSPLSSTSAANSGTMTRRLPSSSMTPSRFQRVDLPADGFQRQAQIIGHRLARQQPTERRSARRRNAPPRAAPG